MNMGVINTVNKFPKDVVLNIIVVFPGEFRIGWEYKGTRYVPSSGSYYDFDIALDKAWSAFQEIVLKGG